MLWQSRPGNLEDRRHVCIEVWWDQKPLWVFLLIWKNDLFLGGMALRSNSRLVFCVRFKNVRLDPQEEGQPAVRLLTFAKGFSGTWMGGWIQVGQT